jgi:hypothetical protein
MAEQEQPTTVTTEQIKAAATAGLRLLDDKDLRVPMDIAISGQLGILKMLMLGVANGQLIFTSPPTPEAEKRPALKSVGGEES